MAYLWRNPGLSDGPLLPPTLPPRHRPRDPCSVKDNNLLRVRSLGGITARIFDCVGTWQWQGEEPRAGVRMAVMTSHTQLTFLFLLGLVMDGAVAPSVVGSGGGGSNEVTLRVVRDVYLEEGVSIRHLGSFQNLAAPQQSLLEEVFQVHLPTTQPRRPRRPSPRPLASPLLPLLHRC